MTRRGALAAVTAAAAVIAVWAAASGTASSRAVANPGVQSVITSILLPLVLFGAAAVLIGMVVALAGPAGRDAEASAAGSSRWKQAVTAAVAIALFMWLAWVIATHRRKRNVLETLNGGASAAVRRHLVVRPVPINHGAFGATAGILAALVVLYLLRHRIRALLGGAGAPFAPLGPALEESSTATTSMADPMSSAPTRTTSSPDPASERDPRKAVVLAYQRFAEVMGRRGLPRTEHETPFEYERRLSRAGTLRRPADQQAAGSLTALFSTARYSREAMTASDRAVALDSLTVITRESADPTESSP